MFFFRSTSSLFLVIALSSMLAGCGMQSTYFNPDELTEIPLVEKQQILNRMTERSKRVTSARLLYDVSRGAQQMRAVCAFNGSDQIRVELFPASLAVSSDLLVKNHDTVTVVQQLKKTRKTTQNFSESIKELIGVPISANELLVLLTGSLSGSMCESLQSLDPTRAVCRMGASLMLISANTGRVLSLEHFGSVGQLQLRGRFENQIAGTEQPVPDEITIDFPRYDFEMTLSLASSAFNKPIPEKLFVIQ